MDETETETLETSRTTMGPMRSHNAGQGWETPAKWLGIIALAVLLGYVAMNIFSNKDTSSQTVAPTVKTLEVIDIKVAIAEALKPMQEEIAEIKAEKAKPVVVEAPQVEVVEETTIPAQTTKVVNVENYRRQNGGSVVRYTGLPVTRNGRKFIPLFKDKGFKGAITEPIDRPVADIQRNMTFDGLKPPSTGKLSVFDVVRDPQTGSLYNILAWEM